MEPLIEDIEQRQELSFRILGALPRQSVDHFAGPHVGAPVQERQHQVVLGRKMSIQGCFRHTGLRHHFVDTDVTDPTMGEQFVAGLDESLTGAECVIARHWKYSLLPHR